MIERATFREEAAPDSADQLRELNSRDHDGQKGDRECSVCHAVNPHGRAD